MVISFMRVLQVNAVNAIRSTGRNCGEMSYYIKVHDGGCFTAYSDGPHTENSYRISSVFECKMHALLSRITGLQGYFSPKSTARLIDIIKEVNPDAVNLGNLHANYLNITELLEFLAENNIPTVLVLHDCWPFTGKCTHYTVKGCLRWQTGCFDCPSLHEDNKSWLFDRTSKMWNDKKRLWLSIPNLDVVGVSDWITNEAKKSPMFKNAKIIKRIYNWIDLDVFKPVNADDIREKHGLTDKKIILGVSSAWSRKKGLDTFLKVADCLKNDEIMLLVGNMPKISLPKNVISVAATDNVNELVKYYNAADVFLQLSEEETFGKVVAEALACGTPVVTNGYTANPELVNASCGCIARDLSPDEIYSSIEKVLESGKKAYSDFCIEFAKDNFDGEKNMGEYLKLYREMSDLKNNG